MVRIAHISDTHGAPSILRSVGQVESDIVLITGDVLSNRGRLGHGIDPRREARYQDGWSRRYAKKWAPAIGDRPVVLIRGNHDFISPAGWLRRYGATVHEITDKNPCVGVCGKKFAGFRQTPWIAGEWCGEEHDLAPHVERALSYDPEILVTHGPPAGILDSEEGYGNRALTSALTYRPHRVTHHFFGHSHPNGGQVVGEMGITFINGAGCCTVHEVP